MTDNMLRAYPLPAELIIKKFVINEQDCNCEKYILEFINKSAFFLRKSMGQLYSPPLSEAHSEHDYNSDTYKVDLKLIGSQTLMAAKSNLSWGKELIVQGVWLTTYPKERNETRETTRIHAALRGLDVAQLAQIRAKTSPTEQYEKDICQFLKKLETKKNLLLFFPYQFRFDNDHAFEEGVTRIQEALNGDFHSAMEYRNSVRAEFDTYFAFLYDEYIVFMEEKDNLLFYVDSVKLNESPIYMKLASYADWN